MLVTRLGQRVGSHTMSPFHQSPMYGGFGILSFFFFLRFEVLGGIGMNFGGMKRLYGNVKGYIGVIRIDGEFVFLREKRLAPRILS